ncbi:hypothetical protein Rhal01_03087 [Rubritalea halochordaticola]|uniref:YtxH domain-containing protein n=2 Tax=Rubritalea halochordaticola TaxID=714537 RepID=A0ABP9V4R6_9BACT
MHSIEQETMIPHSNFRGNPRMVPQHEEKKSKNNYVQDNALAFTLGAFVAGVGIGIFLATTRREELARIAEQIHDSYDSAVDRAGRAGRYVRSHAQELPTELSKIGNRIKFW